MLAQGTEYDLGFGKARAVYVGVGVAHFEHVIADIPEIKMPLYQVVEIVRMWGEALEGKPRLFVPRSFETPE